MARMRYAYNPQTKRRYPGTYLGDNQMILPGTSNPRKRRRKSKAKYRSVAKRRRSSRRRARRNPGYSNSIGPSQYYIRPKSRAGYRRLKTARNPGFVSQLEKTLQRSAGRIPLIGTWAGSAAGTSVLAFGGALSAVYLTKWFLAMDSIADFQVTEWFKTRPHWAYVLGGVLLGAVARVVTPGDVATKRGMQIAVTSAGFGAGTLLWSSTEEDLQEFISAKEVETAEAEGE